MKERSAFKKKNILGYDICGTNKMCLYAYMQFNAEKQWPSKHPRASVLLS